MNKNDLKLILILLSAIICFLLFISFFKTDKDKRALVYYQNKLVKEIDLTISEPKEYIIAGYLDDVILETKKGKIKVKNETSPFHLCSKQGFINNSNQVIVCLPNKVIIKIENKAQSLDAIIR